MIRSEIRILLADDHPLMLEGLASGLHRVGYTCVTTVEDGLQVLDSVVAHTYDVLILDIEMPEYNGFDIVEKLAEMEVSVPVVFLSYHKERRYLLLAKKLKARGYLLKEDGVEVLDKAILEVLKGGEYYSQSIDEAIRLSLRNESIGLNDLTKSERIILKCLAQGLSSAEVAEKLNVSKRTVQNHRFNINQKLKEDLNGEELSRWCMDHQELIDRL